MDTALTRSQFVRWRAAIFAIFLASGLSVATWAGRVPDIKAALEIDKAQVGLLLLGMGIASIVGISSSPAVMARTGARRGMLVSMLCFGAGVMLIGIGTNVLGSLPVVLIGLVLFGLGNGTVDVMMNVEATAIEQQMGKTILPVFHAFFSFGTVLGAGAAALAARLGLDVATHALIMGALIVVTAVVCFLNVPAREATQDPEDAEKPAWSERMHAALEVWREPRTYALGIVMLGMSFAEGGANDWLALGVVEGHHAAPELGAAALAVFSVGMTTVRLVGGPLVDRFGRVPILRVLAATATAGILLFIFADGNLVLVFLGAALWGIGASLGFPLGMSAAADDPAKAAARVSAAATIGYVAFLGGPPVLGFISEHIGLLNTMFILAGLALLSGLFSSAARPLRRTP
ncbi:MFS transporter [Microbacterium resistens]|uniref:MFS transporter n=1 Tax=Microbacterium resistens TaxID=156977 RepID=A0ABY3RP24_9MICO|nr:MFS transporter [Microbacterium resistens]MBW1639799.1 MFS transporter [Microbacterium resistens]UGS25619.1 MFS transporter [Microbacterium resistens]